MNQGNSKYLWLFLLICASIKGDAQTDVLTHHNDLARTGWNNQETNLTTSNVNTATFGKMASLTVDAQVYAQPLVVTNVNVQGVGLRNLLLVASTGNILYAFDADGTVTTPYWTRTLTEAGMVVPTSTDISNVLTGICGNFYFDFNSSIGIIGTPVIDKAANALYVVARSKPGGVTPTGWKQVLHKIDIRTGMDMVNPVEISGSVPGTGDGTGSTVTFNPLTGNQRPGLLLLNGIVYVGYASYCDFVPYHGWLFGYDANNLSQKIIYNSTPNSGEGGFWMSGSAPSADDAGSIYIGSGNGFIPQPEGEMAESILKLTPNAQQNGVTLSSFFTPWNVNALNGNDLDFGITNVLLIPNTNMALAGCKDGNLYLLDRTNMGGRGASSNNVLQTISLGSGKYLHSSIAYYKSNSVEYVYVWSEHGLLSAFPVLAGSNKLGTIPVNFAGQGPDGYNGVLLSVSSNGGTDGTGILWASYGLAGCDPNSYTCAGILRALDANDPTKELWNSSMVAADAVGNYAKFVNPTIANGKVYLATFSNKILIYGLKAGALCGTTNFALNMNASATSSVSANTPDKAVDGNAGTSWNSTNADNQNFEVDLGNKYDICNLVVKWDPLNSGKDFNVQMSNDSSNWTTIKTITGNSTANEVISLTANGYRYILLQGITRNNTGGSVSIQEFEIYGTLSNSCASPTNLTATNITENSATLNWAAVSGASSYSIDYKTVASPSWLNVTSNTNSVPLSALSCGTSYLFRVQGNCSGGGQSALSNGALNTAICTVECNLPTRWSANDIGSIGSAGSSCSVGGEGGVFTLKGSGNDIGGTADAFQFANYFMKYGDLNTYTRVASLDAGNGQNKAGLMIREDLTPGSRNIFVGVTSGSELVLQYRSSTGGATTILSIPGIAAPYWVKLAKSGTSYAAYYSQNGVGWTEIGSLVDLGFGTTSFPYGGFAVTSHNNAVLSTATFDGFGEVITNPLVVKLLDFEGHTVNNQYVLLTWDTQSEQNSDHFEVERSSNLLNFQTIAYVKGAGTSNTKKSYSAVDNNPKEGLNYYRLKQVDSQGISTYSSSIIVRFGTDIAPRLFPNPANSTFTLVQGQEIINEVIIYDMTGKVLKRISNTTANTNLVVTMNELAPGTYIVALKSDSRDYQIKLIKR